PTSGTFSVSGVASARLEIFNLTGSVVHEGEFAENASVRVDLPTGIYIARISSENVSQSVKLIIR
ncbi:MAG: T9SS type A sorting domain-containing protein, partial [Chitinophagaceae bacterium]